MTSKRKTCGRRKMPSVFNKTDFVRPTMDPNFTRTLHLPLPFLEVCGMEPLAIVLSGRRNTGLFSFTPSYGVLPLEHSGPGSVHELENMAEHKRQRTVSLSETQTTPYSSSHQFYMDLRVLLEFRRGGSESYVCPRRMWVGEESG